MKVEPVVLEGEFVRLEPMRVDHLPALVKVGLEDSLWIGAGKLAESNAQQVTQVRKILEGLGLEIASSDEAREILSLKGGDKVAF